MSMSGLRWAALSVRRAMARDYAHVPLGTYRFEGKERGSSVIIDSSLLRGYQSLNAPYRVSRALAWRILHRIVKESPSAVRRGNLTPNGALKLSMMIRQWVPEGQTMEINVADLPHPIIVASSATSEALRCSIVWKPIESIIDMLTHAFMERLKIAADEQKLDRAIQNVGVETRVSFDMSTLSIIEIQFTVRSTSGSAG